MFRRRGVSFLAGCLRRSDFYLPAAAFHIPGRLTGEVFHFPRWVASGGPVSLAREKPGKERGRGVPLHPRCAGR